MRAVRHVYHVPGPRSDGDKPDPVTRMIESAVIRGIADAVRDRTKPATDPDHAEVVPLGRPPVRRRAGPDDSGRAAVPSYQDHGKLVLVSVEPHPMVTGVNRTAELVRKAGPTPPPKLQLDVTPPPGAGIIRRMWHRGAAQDMSRLTTPVPTEEDLAQSQTLLIRGFSAKAVELAGTLLDRNETVVRRESCRYGEPGATVPGSPAVRLRAAAGEMALLQRQILDQVMRTGSDQAARTGAPGAGRPLDAGHFDDILEGSYAQGDLEIQRVLLPRYETLKKIYGVEFPILLGRNLDVSRLAVADPDALAAAVGSTTGDVLSSIAELRRRLTAESVWQLDPVIEAARAVMGVLPGTAAAAALDRYLAGRKRDELIRQLMITALGITLTIGATIATMGAAAPGAAAGLVYLAGGLSLATAGVSVYGAVEHYQSYTFERSASHTALDATAVLSREDPSLAWLVVSIAGAVLDVGAAAIAFRNLSRLARIALAARELGGFEQAVRAQARVLAAEGRLAGTEEDFVQAVLKQARSRIGGAATELSHGGFVFRLNPDGEKRTLAQAIALAEDAGVDIGDDILVRLDDPGKRLLGHNEFAHYGSDKVSSGTVDWIKLTDTVEAPRPGSVVPYWVAEPVESSRRVMVIRLNPGILTSDEAIIAVLAHEMHEVNWLRDALESGGSMAWDRFSGLVNADSGTLHLEAWRVAIDLVRRLRGG